MGKPYLVATLGIVVAIAPFTGFPETYKSVFFVIAGLGLAAVALMPLAEELKEKFDLPGHAEPELNKEEHEHQG